MAKKKRKKIASRGSVNDIILKTLVSGDKYGYEIIKEVEDYSQGKIQLKQPSLYSSLSRFEEKGFVSSYWGDSDIGGRRHYYHLTDKGKLYFNDKNLLKEKSYVKPTESSNIQNTILKSQPSTISNTNSINLENTQISTTKTESTETSNSLQNNSTQSTNTTVDMEEVKDIPAFLNFEENKEKETVIVPDHDFCKETPIEKQIEVIENRSYEDYMFGYPPIKPETIIPKEEIKQEKDESDETTVNDTQNNEKQEFLKEYAESVKRNNKIIANSKFKKLYFKKPQKSQVVILDTDGIYKLRDANYIPEKKKYSEKIIDNVGARINTNHTNLSNYNRPTTTPKQPVELTDEERRQRNENFLAKFNSLTKSRMKPVEVKEVKPEKPKIEIDYRSKLDKFTNFDEVENSNEIESTPPQNNIYNYVDDPSDNVISTEHKQFEITNDTEDEDDKFIDFEPTEFETKVDDKKYVEEISNYNASQNEIKINRYENKSSAILSDKSYVLINKVKCVFGFILLLLLASEISIALLIFKNYNLVYESDRTLFICSYVLAIVTSLIFILPILFNPSEHKLNTFKLKISIIFGILTFLVSVVLIYCINTLLGFDLSNFQYFAVKLILPIILAFNFVIAPIIYAGIIKNKKFYD